MSAADQGHILVPDEEEVVNDRDSAIRQDTASSTQSVTSSILDYRRENGRTYHRYKDGKYNLPNDDAENERLDLQHHLFLLTFNDKLGLAPPNNPESKVGRVLDLGTGTGIWAMDFADDHPAAKVIGIDLSATQPTFVPPNVEFYVDDIDEEWNYSQPFDYIHSRMMNFSVKSWPDYLTHCFENLTPGGYVELQEIGISAKSDDDTLKDDHTLSQWLKYLHEASVKLGREFKDLDNFKDMMRDAGFVDVVETRFKWPSNGWPRDKRDKMLGKWNNENMATALEAATMAPFTRALGWSKEEVTVFLTDVRKDLNNPAIHAYWPIFSVYGKRPEK